MISNREKQRLQIIRRSISGEAIKVVSRELGVSVSKVKRWRARWRENYEELCEVERSEDGSGGTDRAILRKIKEILIDQPRSGTPKRITMAQEQQIVALACEEPDRHGMPFTNWTNEMLAEVIKKKDNVESISAGYVGYILKKIETAQFGLLVISQNIRLG